MSTHWDLKIPVRLTLAPNEITSPTPVNPVYLLAPRQGYLPGLGLQALPYFQHLLPKLPGGGSGEAAPWFESNGLPLKWTLPIGVLYDALAATTDLPWCLTVHYHSPPASLFPWENKVGPRDHFLNSLKEACYICRGSEGSGAVMRMSGAAQDEMWQAVGRGDGTVISAALRSLKATPAVRQGQGPYVPVRVIILPDTTPEEGVLQRWEAAVCTSRPVEALQPDGTATLLEHLLPLVLPGRFATSQLAPAVHQVAAGSPVPSAPNLPSTPAADADNDAAASIDAPSPPAGKHEVVAAEASAASEAAAETAAVAAGASGSGAAHPAWQADAADAGDPGVVTAADSTSADPLGATTRMGSGSLAGSHPAMAVAGNPNGAPLANAAADAVAASSGVVPRVAASTAPIPENVSLRVAGIRPPLHTPLAWLHATLHSPDNFLYVVVRVAPPVLPS